MKSPCSQAAQSEQADEGHNKFALLQPGATFQKHIELAIIQRGVPYARQ
jgi:hypothetical protein